MQEQARPLDLGFSVRLTLNLTPLSARAGGSCVALGSLVDTADPPDWAIAI